MTQPEPSREISDSDISFNTVEERNVWLESRINPGGQLPQVSVRSNEDDPGFLSIHEASGARIGGITLARQTENYPHVSHIRWVEINEPFRSTGEGDGGDYGTAAYLALLKELPLGQGLQSGGSLTRASYAIWRKLEAAGVAIANKTDEEMHHTWYSTDMTDAVNFRTVFGEHDEAVLRKQASQARVAAMEKRWEESRASRTKRSSGLLGKLGLHR